MLSIHQLKSKISVAKSTSQITSALKLICAATYPRVMQKKVALDNYVKNQFEVLAQIAAQNPEEFYDFIRGFSKNKHANLLIIFASSRGLCGAFNSNLEKKIINELYIDPEKALDVILIGRNANRVLSNVRAEKRLNIRTLTQISTSRPEEVLSTFSGTNNKIFDNYERIYLAYNKLKSIFIQQPSAIELVLDFRKSVEQEIKKAGKAEKGFFVWEVKKQEFFQLIAKQFFIGRIIQCAHNSSSGEVAARFVATDQATNNAKKQIDHLTALYNKTRQSQVTNEVIELSTTGSIENPS